MPSKAPPSPDRAWLDTALRQGARWQEALALFDRLDPLPVSALAGRWRGTGVHTGHPDCLLGLMDCRYFPLPLFFALHRE